MFNLNVTYKWHFLLVDKMHVYPFVDYITFFVTMKNNAREDVRHFHRQYKSIYKENIYYKNKKKKEKKNNISSSKNSNN